jgi:recombination protein RecA
MANETTSKDEKEQLKNSPVPLTKFFSTGSTLLNLALGGGWACKRVFNLVGDRSSGKTLQAFEAFANFKRTFGPNCDMRYGEAESRFERDFAESIGFPPEVALPDEPLETVEDFQFDFTEFINGDPKKKEKDRKVDDTRPKLYILDSLDSLSDKDELERYGEIKKRGDEEGGSYGTAKAKKMSALFRVLARDITRANCTLGIISQLRDAIGVSFGEQSTRSGGRALNFYASQIVWLREEGKITRQSLGEERPVGVDVLARVKKCSVAMPFREASFRIIFGYGIDDEISMVEWLQSSGAYPKETAKALKDQIETAREKQDYVLLDELLANIKQDAITRWTKIEQNLAPSIRKYR